MINVPESLANAAVTRTQAEQRTLSTQLANFANRLQEGAAINWETGAVEFDEADVLAAAEELQIGTSFAVGASFRDDLITTLRGGFAVIDREKKDAVPWSALTDPVVVNRLPAERLQALGVSLAPSDFVRSEIGARFINVPPTIDETVTANLIGALRERRVLSTVEEGQSRLTGILPQRPPNGNGGDGGGGGGGGGGGAADIATAVAEFVSQCLPNTTPTELSFSVGPGLCFDETCAWRLQRILSAGGAGTLAPAGAAALGSIGSGISAALTAAVASVGGG
jgi:hypothetical protein